MFFPKKICGMSRKSEASATTLSLLLALAATSVPLAASVFDRPVLAQSPSPAFPLPTAVPNGTTLRINGSRSMEKINQALEQRFESQFSGTTIDAAYDGSDQALQDVLSGETDLAAIGRPLTAAEQTQGLVAVPVARNKIAVIVGADNPFNGSLTANQFSDIFRGQITSWSQVGGTGPLRFVDRPDDSDTRRAFQGYPVFQNAPFQAGAEAVRLAQDSTDAVIAALGNDGIGYAIADQVAANPEVRAILMHETPPTDPRYPFSQPLSYVYRGPTPSPAVQAFLGYATAPANQPVVEEARRAGVIAGVGAVAQASPSPAATTSPSPAATATASPSPSATVAPTATTSPTASPEASPSTTATTSPEPGTAESTERDRAGIPWWLWLLAIPLLGALLWWLLRDREAAPVAATGGVPPIAALPQESRVILTPRDCRDGYVYWEVPEAVKTEHRQQGGRQLQVRLYDVTDIDLDRQPPHNTQQFDCDEQSQDLHISIPLDDRDYIAELGYLTEDDRWLRIARSPHVRVPPCAPTANRIRTTDVVSSEPGTGRLGTVGAVAAGAATALGAGAAARAMTSDTPSTSSAATDESRIILTPNEAGHAYVYWEISEAQKAVLQQQGGRDLRLRVYDATDIDIDEQSAHSVREYKCDTTAQDIHVPLPVVNDNREYIAELGYVTEQGRWLKLARSASVQVPAAEQLNPSSVTAARSTAPTGGAAVAPPIARIDPPSQRSSLLTDESSGADIDSTGTSSTGSIGNVVKTLGAVVAGDAAAAGAGRVASSLSEQETGQAASDLGSDRLATGREDADLKDVDLVDQCRIILVPRNAQSAYAYWEVSDRHKQDLRQQGGQILMLRIHDATNLDIDYQPAHSTQDYICDESERDKHVSIPESDRDYIAELGYVTEDGRWLRLIRSFHVRVA